MIPNKFSRGCTQGGHYELEETVWRSRLAQEPVHDLCAGRREEEPVRTIPDHGGRYQKFLKEVRTWEEQGQEVAAAVESTGNTRYFKWRLSEAGVEVRVINPQRFKVVSQSVHKTDKYDAATIAAFQEGEELALQALSDSPDREITGVAG